MSWIHQGAVVEELPEGTVGFVYCITNLTNSKKYIGKKLAQFSKTSVKTVKFKNGNKRKRKIRSKIESDWRDYYGSNTELLTDIANLGTQNFIREILYFCQSKAQCSYLEAQEQFSRKVLESNDYYNGNIQVRIHKNHINGKI
jgi:hypothetical protein